jgi:hypothetical protein
MRMRQFSKQEEFKDGRLELRLTNDERRQQGCFGATKMKEGKGFFAAMEGLYL